MSRPIVDAYNRGTVEGLVAEAQRARERVRDAAAVTALRLGEPDDGLRPAIRRECEGLIRAGGRRRASR